MREGRSRYLETTILGNSDMDIKTTNITVDSKWSCSIRLTTQIATPILTPLPKKKKKPPYKKNASIQGHPKKKKAKKKGHTTHR